MRRTLTLSILVCALRVHAAFTEFYCDSNVGTNINSGSTTNAIALYTAVNGNWDGTSVYTPTDGSTPAGTVTAGMWAAVFIDGSTNLAQSGTAGGCVMLITNVAAGANGAITFDRSAFMSNSPASGATGRSIKVGGAWNGPKGTIQFPVNYLATTATGSPNVFPRCNLKATSTYSITAAMTHGTSGPMRFQGMTLVPGDGGKATIDGGQPGGTSFAMLTVSGNNNDFSDLILANNGTGGASSLFTLSGTENTVTRVVVHHAMRSGFLMTGLTTLIECEAYLCNLQNAAGQGGFITSVAGCALIRCVSHNQNNANGIGFVFTGATYAYRCIAHSNQKEGFLVSATTAGVMIECEAYDNRASGIDFSGAGAASFYVENSNFLTNLTFGLSSSGSSLRNGAIVNSGLGSGTQTNASGGIASNIGGLLESGSVTYASGVTPWVSPTVGNFSINLPASKSAGRGSFTLYTTNSPTIGYPDIGAAQSSSTNATTRATAFAQ